MALYENVRTCTLCDLWVKKGMKTIQNINQSGSVLNSFSSSLYEQGYFMLRHPGLHSNATGDKLSFKVFTEHSFVSFGLFIVKFLWPWQDETLCPRSGYRGFAMGCL